MTDANSPINPIDPRGAISIGLTKREHFASMAMQGLLSGNLTTNDAEEIATSALQIADTLIEKLNQPLTP